MKYKQGDIVLIPFPFSDLSATKQRPAVIISKDSINHQNYIVAKITSVIRADRFAVAIAPNDTDNALKVPSEVRTNEIFTVHESIIIKKFARFKSAPLKNLTERIKENISVA
jgi:mRNA interferase MazF